MDHTMVTVEEYRQYLEESGTKTYPLRWDEQLKEPANPVIGVTWHEAQSYCVWAGGRLPTSAESERLLYGGLYQWTTDDYDANMKVLRGGSWDFILQGVRASNRLRLEPGDRGYSIGFRCLQQGGEQR